MNEQFPSNYEKLMASLDNPRMFRVLVVVLNGLSCGDKVLIAELEKRGRRSDNYDKMKGPLPFKPQTLVRNGEKLLVDRRKP